MLTPDGVRYFKSGRGELVARPFNGRWLLPLILKDNPRAWTITTRLALLTLLPLSVWYLSIQGCGGRSWLGPLFLAALPGVFKFNWKHPILVDGVGMMLALGTSCLIGHSTPCLYAGIGLAMVTGCVSEKAPVFAALYARSPWPLLGLVSAALSHFLIKSGPDCLDPENDWILNHPVVASLKYHKGRWLDGKLWLAPWGGLLAGLPSLTLREAAILGICYSQCLVMTDTVRLYEWAWPLLLAATLKTVPGELLPALVVVHLMNPWKGEGL